MFGALSGFMGGRCSAVKNSKIYAQSTVIGAISNLILNIVLVHFIGPIGAAIATVVSYWIVFVIRVFHMKQLIKIKIYHLRDYASYLILTVQSIVLLYMEQSIVMYTIQMICILSIVILYISEIKSILHKVKIIR